MSDIAEVSLNTSIQTLLGFDYGTRKIGVASGQTITGTASSLTVIPVHKGKIDWPAIETLVRQWRPQAFVVGMPFNMDGTESDMAAQVRDFSGQLEDRFNRPVFEVDERLTTREARDITRRNAELNGRKYHDRAVVDAVAAQLILESWFSENL